MSTWCSGWNSHKTNRGHIGDFRRVPFRTSCLDLEGRCGWFQNGKRVPIWKSLDGFPLGPTSCLLPNLCPSPSKAPVVRFPSKFLPTSASPGLSGCRRTPIGTPFPKKTSGTGQDGARRVRSGLPGTLSQRLTSTGHKLFADTSAGPGPLRRAAEGSSTSAKWGAMRPFSVAAARAISMRDRERAKFSRNKGENVEKRRSQTHEGTISPPTELCRVDELSISAMVPGDIFLIERLEATGLNSERTFYAILACPLCGNQALISAAQYFGYAPVICGARACAGFFRIIDEVRLIYLPVN